MSAPLISFCLPVFNAGKTIARCLESVLRQGLSEVEILVVDNASEDDTVAVASAALAGLPNAKILRNDRNLGRIANWNRCLQLAGGKYVKFALANDVFLDGAVPLMCKIAEQNGSAVLVASRGRVVESLTETREALHEPVTAIRRTPIETLRFFAEQKFLTGSLMGSLFQREAMEQRQLRFREDIPYCADFFFTIQLVDAGASVFLGTDTFLFNAGAVGRYHFAGMQNPRQFFLEHRICYQELEDRLRRHQNSSDHPFRTLLGQYLDYLSKGVPLKPTDTFGIFAGHPHEQWTAFAKTLWFNLKNRR